VTRGSDQDLGPML